VALPRTAASIPDGMAAAALVGVNPIHGLYAGFAGPIVGGLTTTTKLMVITTTSAASLAAFSALQSVSPDARLQSLFLLTIMAGLILVIAGFLGLGRFTAFVSHSVMTGFLTGVAVSILLGQIPDLVGAAVDAPSSVGRAAEVLFHPGAVDVPTMLIGATALLLLVALSPTGLGKYAALIALSIPSLMTAFIGYFDGVAIVSDAGEIVRGLPLPQLPSLGDLSINLLVGAFAVAAIVMVQGAGVSQAYPNPDRSRSSQDRDLFSQGAANVASGLFRGIPVGGSVSQTALNVSLGARDIWPSVMSGVWLIVVLVVLSTLAGQVAIPTLAAILIVASIGAIRPAEIAAIWQSGVQSQVATVTTFAATLFLPVAAAVGIGVALSLLLSINREAQDVRVVQLVENPDGSVVEQAVTPRLRSNSVTILNIYGSLFYAGARTFEGELPEVGDAERAVVVIRLRGRTVIGATAFSILSSYAGELAEGGGRLYLSGISPELMSQFRSSGRIGSSGPITVFEAASTIGASTRAAIADGESYLLAESRGSDEESVPAVPWIRRLWAQIARLWSGGSHR
jgi:sulfate permease, SulP family